jgi:hypothetical protein
MNQHTTLKKRMFGNAANVSAHLPILTVDMIICIQHNTEDQDMQQNNLNQ